MTKYTRRRIAQTLAIMALGLILITAINAIWQGAVSSAAFFNAIGALFTGVLK